jgi:hypothetical protein
MWLLGKGVRFVAGLLGLLYFLWVVVVGGGLSWMSYQTRAEIEAAEAERLRSAAEYANIEAGYGTRDPSFRHEYSGGDEFDESYGEPDRSADYTDGGWGAPGE